MSLEKGSKVQTRWTKQMLFKCRMHSSDLYNIIRRNEQAELLRLQEEVEAMKYDLDKYQKLINQLQLQVPIKNEQ